MSDVESQHATRLTKLDQRVLAVLTHYRDGVGVAHMTRAFLARKSECAESTIPKSVRRLEQAGRLKRRPVRNAIGMDCGMAYIVLRASPGAKKPRCGTFGMLRSPRLKPRGKPVLLRSITPPAKPETFGGIRIGAVGSQKESSPTPPKEKLPTGFSEPKGSSNPVDCRAADFCDYEIRPSSRKAKWFYTDDFLTLWRRWPEHRRLISDKRLAMVLWTRMKKFYSAEIVLRAAEIYLANPFTRENGFEFCQRLDRWLGGVAEGTVERVAEEVWNAAQAKKASRRSRATRKGRDRTKAIPKLMAEQRG